MLNRILLVALIAGTIMGFVMTAVQMSSSIPLILFAETFEDAGGADTAAVAHAHAAVIEGEHPGEAEAWGPEDGLERTFWSMITNVLLGFGAGLVLAAGLVLHKLAPGKSVDARVGLAWGAAAFLAFSLAPALGLPPELPGTAAAELEARQIWWIGTALATAAGLALMAYGRLAWVIVAIGLFILPHAIGAPHPEVHEALVSDDVQRQFIIASLGTSAVFWLLLGHLTGELVRRVEVGGASPAAA
jgi:cobalt transporter subunit CbtA